MFLIPLIIKVPSFVFYAIMTIGSVEIIEIQVKTGKKIEAPLVTATAYSRWRSHMTVMTLLISTHFRLIRLISL